jgi:hypothetical protein
MLLRGACICSHCLRVCARARAPVPHSHARVRPPAHAYSRGPRLGSPRADGLPAPRSLTVEGLAFDPDLVLRGLIIDKDRGTLIKVDRFGLVKRAMHGTRMMTFQEIRSVGVAPPADDEAVSGP